MEWVNPPSDFATEKQHTSLGSLAILRPASPVKEAPLGLPAATPVHSSVAQLLATLGDESATMPATLVLNLPANTDTNAAAPLPERVRATAAQTLQSVQDWLSETPLAGTRLVVVTHNGIAAGPGQHDLDLAAASVWGLIRVAASENPGRLA